MKKPTVYDASKQEFVKFFTESIFGRTGLFRFEQWLSDERYKKLDSELQDTLNSMNEENKAMYECSQKALEQTDNQKKIEWYTKASEHQENWDKLNKRTEKLQKEIDEFIGL